MKKKLIAAVTSLVMVATMVPATVSATEGAQDVSTVKKLEKVASARATTDFETAMEALGGTTTVDKYSSAMDVAIGNACAEYNKLNPTDIASVKTLVEQLKGLVEVQWKLRMSKLDDEMSLLKTEIEPADATDKTLKAIGNLKTTAEGFYGTGTITNGTLGSSDSEMYKALAADKLDLAAIKSLAESTFKDALETYTDAEAVKDAVLAIAEIKDVTDLNYDNGDSSDNNTKISAAKTAYDNISKTDYSTKEELQKKVGNYSTLLLAEKAKTDFEQQVTDAAAILAKVDSTMAITKDNFAKIKAAYEAGQRAFDNLPTGLQDDGKLTSDVARLSTAKTNIDAFQKKLDAAEKVQAMLDTLPAGTNAADAATILLAKKAYDELTDNSLISSKDKAKLDFAVATMREKLLPNGKADEAAIAEAVKPVKDVIAKLPATITVAEKAAVLDAYAKYEVLIGFNSALANKFTKEEKAALASAYSQATKMNTTDETVIKAFVDAVKAIEDAKTAVGGKLKNIKDTNVVNDTYQVKTLEARAAYEKLNADQKKMVTDGVTVGTVTDAKEAYAAMLIAEANVVSAAKIPEVAKLMMLIPDAATLDLKDEAAVKKVKDAYAAFEALAKGAQTALSENTSYASYYKNYTAAAKKVLEMEAKNAAQTVINAIKALPAQPKEFTAKADVDAVFGPLTQAEKAYEALTDAQKVEVTNAATLNEYRKTFDVLMTTYTTKLYAEAAKIDVTKELSKTDAAKIAELKAYIDDKYITTDKIDGFKAATYEALVAALADFQKNVGALENAKITVADQTYTGSAVEPSVTVTDKTGDVVADTEYTVIYSNNTAVGTATVTVAAKSGSFYTGSVSQTFAIKAASIAKATVTGVVSKTYTGKALTQKVVVKANGKTLKNGTDYTVSYKNNKNVGKATVTVKAKGNYTGTITKTFIVKPAKESITSLKKGTKRFTVKYKKQTGAKYQIYYKTAGSKAKTVKTSAVTKTVKNLKKGKTYTVKVRAYKAIDGKTYYGAYSKAKKVKVR